MRRTVTVTLPNTERNMNVYQPSASLLCTPDGGTLPKLRSVGMGWSLQMLLLLQMLHAYYAIKAISCCSGLLMVTNGLLRTQLQCCCPSDVFRAICTAVLNQTSRLQQVIAAAAASAAVTRAQCCCVPLLAVTRHG
jgi:hypothetical protein